MILYKKIFDAVIMYIDSVDWYGNFVCQPISFSCSYINQRNRTNNIKQAEEAMRKEWIESKNAAADPFTRQSCRPVLGEFAVLRVKLRLHYFPMSTNQLTLFLTE